MAKNSSPPPATPQINLIAEGTEVEGTLKASDDLRVSGVIIGTLHVDGKAILAEEGKLDGDLHATDADVAGTVEGNLYISGRLVVKGTAHIKGTIRTKRLIVEEGAEFDGQCEMGTLDKTRAAQLKSGNGSSSSGATPAGSTSGSTSGSTPSPKFAPSRGS
ncbi:MAG: polymer-forming cytoskeletal protein [Rhodothermales bacterium]|nr:polymer-forming cytoskeletal protein [Rhodothermales bacterium]